MKRNDPVSLRRLVGSTSGRIFSALFVKANLEARRMVCRLVRLSPELLEEDRRNHVMTVWDLQKHGFRRIPLERLVHVRCGSIEWLTEVKS